MPQFTYTALQTDGKRVTGTVEAWSIQAARDALRQMHLVPEKLEALTTLLSTPPAESVEESLPPPLPSPSTALSADESIPDHTYFPLLDTLRLYAGWLIAWYCLVYAIGSYQHFRPLPFQIPYVEGLFLSPLVLSFTLSAYLFLLLTSIWKAIGKGIFTGLLLTGVGIAVFLLYRMNVL